MRVLRHLSWALPLALGAVLLCIGITDPWVRSYDANGARESIAARNHLRYGLAATRGGQVVNGGELTPERLRFYAHHPSGLSLTVAASFALFGEHEWSARLVPIAFTLGAAVLLYLLADELAGPWAGFFAMLVFAVQPMVAFYGAMPDHEAPAAFFALLLTWLYLRWQREGRKAWLVGMCVAAFVGLWYAWVVFAMPCLLLGYYALVKGRGWRWMLLPAGAAVAGFLCVVGHVALVEGGLGELWQALAHRLGSQARDRAAEGSFTLAEFVARQGVYFWTCFSVVALAVCVAWALGLGRRGRADILLVAVLALFALVNVVGFRQGAYVHIYYQFYLALPLAVAAGLALDGLRRRWPRRWLPTAAALLAAAVIAGEGWVKLMPIRYAGTGRYYIERDVAGSIAERTEADERLLVVWPMRSSFRQLTWYADRDLTVVPDRASSERLLAQRGFDARIWVKASVARWSVEIERLKPSPPARPRAPGR